MAGEDNPLMVHVDVPGLGSVPMSFETPFDGANFEGPKTSNFRNEGCAEVKCDCDDWANDEFNMSAKWDSNNRIYSFKVAVNSEIGRGNLWNDGEITFNYDSKTKHWTMSSFIGGAEHAFCNPEVVVDMVIAGVGCFIRDSETDMKDPLNDELGIIANSISNDKDYIVSHAKVDENCSHECPPPPPPPSCTPGGEYYYE